MKRRMKVLVGYDGSAGADAALADLARAGLPREAAVLVATVGEVGPLAPPLGGEEATETVLPSGKVSTALARAYERAMKAHGDAYLRAVGAGERLRGLVPAWEVTAEVLNGSPAKELLRRAAGWPADLIVIGSHGRSALGRLVLGSVSREVAAEATCAVRVGRRGVAASEGRPPQLVIGVDGSMGAERAVRAVCGRVWPEGARARVIAVEDEAAPLPREGGGAERPMTARQMAEWAREALWVVGLSASDVTVRGEPLRLIITAAGEWGADCVFVGAGAPAGLGRVAAGLVTGAHCSVEVVR